MTNKITNIPNCYYRISIKALIIDEEKRFLLALEDNGKWEFPGGGIDFGENPLECLAREIKEEMGLEVIQVNERPSYVLTLQHSSGVWICHILYEVKTKNLDITPSGECTKIQFFTKEEALKENLFSNVVEFISVYNPNNHELKK